MKNFLKSLFKKSPDVFDDLPAGVCPNCWGEQEYDNTIREMYVDKQIDVNNHEANHAFIQEYIVTRVKGIKLIKGNNSFECPTCRTKFAENQ